MGRGAVMLDPPRLCCVAPCFIVAASSLVGPRLGSSLCGARRKGTAGLDHAYRSPPSASGSMWSTSAIGRRQPGCSQMGLAARLSLMRSPCDRPSSGGRVLPSHVGLQGQRVPRPWGLRRPHRAQAAGAARGISRRPIRSRTRLEADRLARGRRGVGARRRVVDRS